MTTVNDNLRDELMRIRADYGELTAENVVRAASSPTSPLHGQFEWDDNEAAYQYRLVQARRVIRFIKEPYVRPTGEAGKVRYFHAQQDDNRTVYSPLSEVVQDPIAAQILLRQAEREWRALWSRYSHLAEWIGIVQGTVKVAAPEAAEPSEERGE